MTPRHIAMAAALVLAAALVVFGDSKPESSVAEAVERSAPLASVAPSAQAPGVLAPPGGTAQAREPAILRLTPRAILLGEDDDAMGGGQNVFGSQNWAPPPPPAPAPDPNPPPPPAPVAPPLPFVYIGKAAADGSWEVFLSRGDKTYSVRDKTVIDGTYRVDAIAPPNLTLTYLPLNQVQQLNIGVLD